MISSADAGVDILQQLGHGRTPMVAGDVGVQLLPDPFDPVVIGTIRRQEVQPELLTRRRGETLPDQPRRMDRVVVQDDVDPFRLRETLRQAPLQQDKQGRVLAAAGDGNQFFRPHLLRPGHRALLVLAGREHLLLLTAQHPVHADPGVQRKVGLVFVDRDFVRRQLSHQVLDLL